MDHHTAVDLLQACGVRGGGEWSPPSGAEVLRIDKGVATTIEDMPVRRLVPLARMLAAVLVPVDGAAAAHCGSTETAGKEAGAVVLVDEPDVWPSSQDWAAFARLRGEATATADIQRLPGTVVRAGVGEGTGGCDGESRGVHAGLSSLLAVLLAGGVGFVAASVAGKEGGGAGGGEAGGSKARGAVRLDHEGRGWVATTDSARLSRFAAWLARAS